MGDIRMIDNLTTTDQQGTTHGVKCLVYGGPGSGKTYMARTCPNVIILSAESGLLSLRDVSLPVLVIRTVQELEAAYQWLAFDSSSHPYTTVYLDSISEIAETILATEKKGAKDPRAAYGELVEQTMAQCKKFRDLPGRDVVFCAKEGPFTEPVTNLPKAGPTCPGQRLANELPYLFDLVMRLEVHTTEQGERYRLLRTGPSPQAHAKDRSGVLAEYEYPDLGAIFSKIKGI